VSFLYDDSLPSQAKADNSALVRRIGLSLVVLAAILIVGCTLRQGSAGLIGSLVGLTIVFTFFGLDVLALWRTRSWPALNVSALMVGLYVVKLLLVLLTLLVLRHRSGIDHPSLIVSVVVGSLGASIAGVILWSRVKISYVIP